MKRKILCAALTAALGMTALVSQSANAVATVDGTININGKVIADTCMISINSGTAAHTRTSGAGDAGLATGTVTLPVVRVADFSGPDQVVSSAPVNIHYSECDTISLTSVQPNFSASSNLNSTNGRLNNTSAANGVDILLTESDGTPLNLTVPNAVRAKNLTGGIADIDLLAKYISNSNPIAAGAVTTTATFTTNYQ